MLLFAMGHLPCLIASVGAALYFTDIIKLPFQYVVGLVSCLLVVKQIIAIGIHFHASPQRKERSKDYLARFVEIMLCP
jgi:hypothetical protein